MSRDMLLDLAGEIEGLTPKDIRFLTVPLSERRICRPRSEAAVEWDRKARQRWSSTRSRATNHW